MNEFIECDLCGGKGSIIVIVPHDIYRCPKCHGFEKLLWLEVFFGKINDNKSTLYWNSYSSYYRYYSYTIEDRLHIYNKIDYKTFRGWCNERLV